VLKAGYVKKELLKLLIITDNKKVGLGQGCSVTKIVFIRKSARFMLRNIYSMISEKRAL
jgi:hypothetical protein